MIAQKTFGMLLLLGGCTSELILFDPAPDGGVARDGGQGDAARPPEDSRDAGSDAMPGDADVAADAGPELPRLALGLGSRHSCAVRAGALYCWGAGADGRTGLGDSLPRDVPTRVAPERADFVDVCGGEEHSCALSDQGAVLCWGRNLHGELGLSDFDPRLVPTPLPDLRLTRLSCGGYNTCGLGGDGSLWCWGDNFEGKLGQGDAFDSPDGPTPTRVSGAQLFRDVALGQGHACAVTREGELLCWGRNTDGQLGIGRDVVQVRAPTKVNASVAFRSVAAGQGQSCAIAVDDSLYCWGTDSSGSLAMDAAPGTVLRSPAQVNGGGAFSDVSLSAFHVCAVRREGSLFCAGRNVEGQLGLGDFENRSSLSQVGAARGYARVALGRFHTCALNETDVYCWGSNDDGELGLGDAMRRDTPALVALP